jgi:hypothetical protein
MYSHRLQLLLDEERYKRVTELARQRRTSVATIIRAAIDRGLPASPQRRSAAADRILGAEPMTTGDESELRTELDELRGRRA